ncbi:hypothetical protein GCM10011608_24930 [Micromonospora sonchi]|uniref:Uncharacterized protein n=1 Tax=Micromonospora sonchi TaxID=1763543 RepID=A0A917TV97_9ACTN|nr:hypothetical protein GCM10011608_24930 [Micromonospora sonchi]
MGGPTVAGGDAPAIPATGDDGIGDAAKPLQTTGRPVTDANAMNSGSRPEKVGQIPAEMNYCNKAAHPLY